MLPNYFRVTEVFFIIMLVIIGGESSYTITPVTVLVLCIPSELWDDFYCRLQCILLIVC